VSAVLRALVERLLDREDLARADAEALLDTLVAEDVAPELKAAALAALRAKGETAVEIAGIAAAMRARAVPVRVPRDLPVIDTCGTGGDGKATINVSSGWACRSRGPPPAPSTPSRPPASRSWSRPRSTRRWRGCRPCAARWACAP
jgi:hypothetical protein